MRIFQRGRGPSLRLRVLGALVDIFHNLAGTSGSVTVTHTGPYGDLVGKAVALEPATGFSFDTPAIARPR